MVSAIAFSFFFSKILIIHWPPPSKVTTFPLSFFLLIQFNHQWRLGPLLLTLPIPSFVVFISVSDCFLTGSISFVFWVIL